MTTQATALLTLPAESLIGPAASASLGDAAGPAAGASSPAAPADGGGVFTVDQAMQIATKHCDSGRHDLAETICRQVLEVAPRQPLALYCMGVVAVYSQKHTLARDFMKWAVDADPNEARFMTGLGAVERFCGNFERSIEVLKYVNQRWPLHADAYDHLSASYEKIRRLPQAIETARQAIKINGTMPSYHITIATQLLMCGQWTEAWREYEWRWFDNRMIGSKHNFKQPWWSGDPDPGKTVLITAEQGLGDTLHAARYAQLLVEHGLKVVVGCQDVLAPLMARVDGVSQAIVQVSDTPEFHYQLPMLSAPRVFKTTVDNTPNRVPYISADPALVRSWRDKLVCWEADLARDAARDSARPQRSDHAADADSSPASATAPAGAASPGGPEPLRVGLAWCGNPKQDDNHFRSMHLKDFAPLAEAPNTIFVSLQKGDAGAESTNPPPRMRFIDAAPHLQTFADSAALVENLDLLITIDSSPAHLAGAMGKPLWVLLSACSAWQWLLNRLDSPWYPTARLFRQKKLWDWPTVVRDVRTELMKVARARQRGQKLFPNGR